MKKTAADTEKEQNQVWKVKTELKLIAVCIRHVKTEHRSEQTTCHVHRVRVTFVLPPCSHSLPFYLKASGLTSARPHQTLKPYLQTQLGDRKKNAILQRNGKFFFIYYLRHAGTKHT